MIIDASVLLCAYFPDESQAQAQNIIREHIAGRLQLKAPALLPYEVNNAVWQAERRGRISASQAEDILISMAGLEIEIHTQGWETVLPLARKFSISGYDAAYLQLANTLAEPLVTGDRRFFQSVQKEYSSIIWIGDIQIPEK
jgi:predicted nucleic acid-binding protein